MINIIEEFGSLEYSTVGSILSDPGYINHEDLYFEGYIIGSRGKWGYALKKDVPEP